jgi:hypothetical protein
MPRSGDQRAASLRPAIVLFEVGILFLALSVIALAATTISLWLLAVSLILVHTILFYRLGRLAERIRSQSSPDFFRGLKQGLMRRPD